MIRILHLADLHLGWEPAFLRARAAERRRERDGLLSRAVDMVLDREAVDLVIIAGDLFETHTPPDTLAEAVIADLERLTAEGIQVVTVPGNHDEITYADSVYRRYNERWPGVLIQNPMPDHVTTLDVRGTPVHIYGLAYTGGLTRPVPPISQFPRLEERGLHIAVFHGSLDWDAGERSLPLMSDALQKAGYDYVALGHIHRHSVHELGRGRAVYAGAVEGKSFSDPGTGTFTFVQLGNGHARVELKAAGARLIKDVPVDVTDCDDVDAVLEKARATADPEAIVRLRLTGAAPGPLSVAVLEKRLADSFYFIELVDETTLLDDDIIAALAAEPTVRGQFVRRLQAKLDDEDDETERALLAGALRRGLAALEGSGS